MNIFERMLSNVDQHPTYRENKEGVPSSMRYLALIIGLIAWLTVFGEPTDWLRH